MVRQTSAIAVSAAAVLLAYAVPASVAWLLVVSGLAAAMFCAFAVQRLAPEVRAPWNLMAFAQLLNGLGNLVIAFDSKKWLTSPDWVSAVLFNGASIATVLGIVGLSLPRSRRLIPIAVDLLVITGCAMGLAVMWNLGRFFGQPTGDVGTLLGLMGFVAVVVELVGLGFCVVAWNCQPIGWRTANRLAVLAHVAATLGDTEMLGNYLGVPFELVSLSWLTSSLLILVAATFLPGMGEPVRWVRGHVVSRVALAFAVVQVASLLVRPVPVDSVKIVLAAVLVTVAVKQLADLGRRSVSGTAGGVS